MMALLNTLLALLIIHSAQGKYYVHPVISDPGLYYEQQDTAFLRKTTWRVIVHLNLEPYSEEHNLYSNYYELLHECRDNLGEEFCEFFDNKGAGNKQQTIDALKKSIKQAKNPLKEASRKYTERKDQPPLPS
ncbi:hypothetical protein TKK_0000214 [Trichogramma kaykai]